MTGDLTLILNGAKQQQAALRADAVEKDKSYTIEGRCPMILPDVLDVYAPSGKMIAQARLTEFRYTTDAVSGAVRITRVF